MRLLFFDLPASCRFLRSLAESTYPRFFPQPIEFNEVMKLTPGTPGCDRRRPTASPVGVVWRTVCLKK
jgi:hypothetical protein